MVRVAAIRQDWEADRAADRKRLPTTACRSRTSSADAECDLFKRLYEDLFPQSLRHQLGEYYTPDWLARHVLDQVGYEGGSRPNGY